MRLKSLSICSATPRMRGRPAQDIATIGFGKAAGADLALTFAGWHDKR
mgnify:CR=1 FL=1